MLCYVSSVVVQTRGHRHKRKCNTIIAAVIPLLLVPEGAEVGAEALLYALSASCREMR